jgi:hypothetical protein
MAKKLLKSIKRAKAATKKAAAALGAPVVPSKATSGARPLRSEIAKRVRSMNKHVQARRLAKSNAAASAKKLAKVKERVTAQSAPSKPAKLGNLKSRVASRSAPAAPVKKAAIPPSKRVIAHTARQTKTNPHYRTGLPGKNLKVGKGHVPTAKAKGKALVLKSGARIHPTQAKFFGNKLRKANPVVSKGGRAFTHGVKNHADRQKLAAWLKANR